MEGSLEISNCEIFVEIVLEKWLFLCVEVRNSSVVERCPARVSSPHKGIAGFTP